jgi:PAS domain S-box-containing protein
METKSAPREPVARHSRQAAGFAHLVQFYERDAFLAERVTEFVDEGFRAGEAAVVIATAPHRRIIEEALAKRGFDLASARSEGWYVPLDAADTLPTILLGGSPDVTRWTEVVGEVLRKAGGGTRNRVRVFGEMVALLWNDGLFDAAIRLEEIWNQLGRSLPLSLLCGYPIGGFGRESDAVNFAAICRQHSNVVPTEGYTALTSPDAHLRKVAELEQKARALRTEIGERRQAEAALLWHRKDFDDFFENAPIALHCVAPDGTILRANRAELELLGYDEGDYVGHAIGEFHVDERASRDILLRLSRAETLSDVEAQWRCRDGSFRTVLLDCNALVRDGEVVHARCFLRDITERKRAEAQREEALAIAQRARREAEAANHAKDVFLSLISHELRTPLTAMLGWTKVLRSGVTAERMDHALNAIEHSGRAQAKLIDDLLDVSRIVGGNLRLDLQAVDLGEVVGAALERIRPSAEAKGVRIEARLDARLDRVAGDAERLQQVVWNLLSNAVKFTPFQGTVKVVLERRGACAALVVRDTGRGISPQFLPFVFDRFRQADSLASRRTGGLGLGLAIVRQLVELHGGAVRAASKGEGQGSEFTVTLPIP